MKQKTYLVAGGAGFLGSHMVERILSEGQKVICIDNFLTGIAENISAFKNNSDFVLIEGDICNKKVLELDGEINYVLNYACPASPIDYRQHPVETLEVCSAGVKNLLELSRRKKARFFHTSTSEVYGDPLVHPQTESYWGRVNSYGERSCYDEGKRYAEALIYIYNKDFKVDTAVVRIFNTYGPRMKPFDGRVVSTFIRQALAGEDITIFGDGSQTRSFCYISDQIEGHWRLIQSKESGPINIGNPGEFTMLELAQKIIEITKTSSNLIHKPLPADDPMQRCPDITKARQSLSWEAVVQLDEGIKKTIEWFKHATTHVVA